MKAIAAAFSVFVLAAAAEGRDADPLAPAREGMILCFGPDSAGKTCVGTVVYRFEKDGAIKAEQTLPLAIAPGLAIRLASDVYVRSGAICATLDPRDLKAAAILRLGKPLSKKQAAPMLANYERIMAPMYGSEVCSRLVPYGGGYQAHVAVNGTDQPNRRPFAVWVANNAGYRQGFPAFSITRPAVAPNRK